MSQAETSGADPPASASVTLYAKLIEVTLVRSGKISTTIAPWSPSAMPRGIARSIWPNVNCQTVPYIMICSDRVDEHHRDDREAHHESAPPGAIREPAAERFGEQHHHEAQRVRQKECRSTSGKTVPSFHYIRERQVVGRVRHGDDAERADHRQPVREKRRNERRPLGRSLEAFSRFLKTPAQEPSERRTNSTLATNGIRHCHSDDVVGADERVDQPRGTRAENEADRSAGRGGAR